MPSYDLPEGFKNHEKYLIGDAARYWAAALYAVPLGIDLREERTRYARELKLAEMELREKVPVQSENYWDTVRKTRQVPCGDSWNGYTRVAYTETVGKIREYFRGPDLAEYAKERGYPGLFGFEELDLPATNETDSLRADTKEGYLFLIGLLVHTIAEMGGPAMKTPKGPNKTGILERLGRTARSLGVAMDGLGKSQGNEKLSAALAEIENRKRDQNPRT